MVLLKKRSHTSVRTTSEEHPFLELNLHPRLSEDERQKLKDDFNQIRGRGIEIGRTMDRDFLRGLQVEDEIKAYFRRDLKDGY